MFNQFEIFRKGKQNHECLKSIRTLKSKYQKNNIAQPPSANLNFHNKHINFDQREELKGKIIRAILTNSEVIEEEMNYKRSFVWNQTPKSSSQCQSYKINLYRRNNKERKSTLSEIKAVESTRADSTKYNNCFETDQMVIRGEHGEKTMPIPRWAAQIE
jgi:hypothetical protein